VDFSTQILQMLVKKKKQDTKKDAFPLPNLTENKKYEESKNQLNNNAPNPNIVRAPDMKKILLIIK